MLGFANLDAFVFALDFDLFERVERSGAGAGAGLAGFVPGAFAS